MKGNKSKYFLRFKFKKVYGVSQQKNLNVYPGKPFLVQCLCKITMVTYFPPQRLLMM